MLGASQQEQLLPIPLIVITRCSVHHDELGRYPFIFAFAYTKNMIDSYKKLVTETNTPFEEILLLHIQDEATKAGMVDLAKQEVLTIPCPESEKTEDEIQFDPSFNWKPLANSAIH